MNEPDLARILGRLPADAIPDGVDFYVVEDGRARRVIVRRPETPYPPWWQHYLLAVGMWITIIGLGGLLRLAFPVLRYSLWTAAFGYSSHTSAGGISGVSWPVLIFLLVVGTTLLVPRIIWRAARREEERYRRYAERWSFLQRAESCIRFGLAHVWNFVIPFAYVLALIVGGAYLMSVYLRAFRRTKSQAYAVEVATRAHVAYNRVVLAAIAIILVAAVASGG